MGKSLIVLDEIHDDFFKSDTFYHIQKNNCITKSKYIRELINLDINFREWRDKSGR